MKKILLTIALALVFIGANAQDGKSVCSTLTHKFYLNASIGLSF